MQEPIDIISCVLLLHMIKKPAYEDDESSIEDRLILKHVTTEALESLGATPNVIDIWFKLLNENYDARRVAYSTAIKEMLKQIPTMMTKPPSQRQKSQKLMTEFGDGW